MELKQHCPYRDLGKVSAEVTRASWQEPACFPGSGVVISQWELEPGHGGRIYNMEVVYIRTFPLSLESWCGACPSLVLVVINYYITFTLILILYYY